MADETFQMQLTHALTSTASPVMQGTWATVRADYVRPIGKVPIPLQHLHALAFKLKNQAEKANQIYHETNDDKDVEEAAAKQMDLFYDYYEVTRKLFWQLLKEAYPVPIYSPELIILDKWKVGQLIKPLKVVDPDNSIDLLNVGTSIDNYLPFM